MNKPENCSRCKGLGDKPENLVNFLHNPIAPYFSSAYVTIISVVCGIALAAVFYMAVEQQVVQKDRYHPVIIWEFVISIMTTAVIWHEYIKIIQYKAWPINLYDTLIPIIFSVLIVILSVNVEDVRMFCLIFALLCLTGGVSYKNSLRQLLKESSIDTYQSHYDGYGDNFYKCVFGGLSKYIANRNNTFLHVGVSFFVASLVEFLFAKPHYNGLDAYILCLSMTSISLYFFVYDLNTELKKIKCLSEYY